MTPYTYINSAVAPMHALPTKNSEMVSQAIYATSVTIIKQEGQWAQIRTPDNYEGWTPLDLLISRPTAYKMQATVSGLWTHICVTPDTTPYPPLITLPYGVTIAVAERTSGERWMRICLLDETLAWAQQNDFRFVLEPLSIDKVLLESRRFIGIPYLWGGNSSFGFDCSGYIQSLFLQRGITLPRDARLQINDPRLRPIESTQIIGGDLLFFGKTAERITHVGLALNNKEFIHAVTTNRTGPHAIQISLREAPEWQTIFQRAARL